MLFYHDDDPAQVITGSSTRNERIERLWLEVFRCVSWKLEHSGVLDAPQ